MNDNVDINLLSNTILETIIPEYLLNSWQSGKKCTRVMNIINIYIYSYTIKILLLN